MMKIKLIFGLIFIVKLAFSQNLKPILGADYRKYVIEMDAYFANRDKGKGSGYKQFMRLKHEMDAKVGSDGLMKNFQAINQAEYNLLNQKSANAKIQATHGLWEDLGPHDFSGSDIYSNNALARVNCIAFHPTNPNIIWAGTPAGGLWKTIDHGGSWTCITNNFASAGVSSVIVDPVDPNIIYILTGDGDAGDTSTIGVMKTTDGGTNWKETGLKFGVDQFHRGFTMRMHPTNRSILLTIGTFGIMKTVDAGTNWTNVEATAGWDIEFKPGDPSIIYAVNVLGIYKSTNTGNSFTPINTGFPLNPADPTPPLWRRLSLAVSPSIPNNIYVLCGGVPSSGVFAGLYKSTDGGNSWVLKSTTPNIFGSNTDGSDNKTQAWYDIDLDVDPTNDARIFIGGINIWKSDNSGANWSRETNWQRGAGAVDPFVHADQHHIKFKGSRVYAANDGGVYYSDDFGHSWGDISSGIGATQFYNIDIDGSGYIGGTQDNGANEGTFGNMQMHNIGGGDAFGSVWHAGDHSIQFISSQNSIIRRQFGSNLFIYQDDNNFWYTILKNATNNTGILFATHKGNRLIRGNQTEFGGPWDWSWHDTGNSANTKWAIVGYSQAADNPNIMYLAHSDTLLKSTNIYSIPATWTKLPDPEPGLKYDDIVTDPTNSQKVWVVCSQYQAGKKVYRSINGGTTWTNISGNLPNVPIHCIALLPGGGDKLYIGTAIGVFYRSALMTDWAYYSNRLPNTKVNEIRLSSTHVYAGTFGRGIWRSELYSSCPPTLALTPANETNANVFAPGTQQHSASVSLTSTRQYSGSVGTNINYNATNFVELKEGFEIKKDAVLLVKNKGCPD